MQHCAIALGENLLKMREFLRAANAAFFYLFLCHAILEYKKGT